MSDGSLPAGTAPVADMSMAAALRRPVLLRTVAESAGEVKGYLVDQPPRRVVAVHVAGKGRKALVVDWEHLAFGPDAVVVDRDESLRSVGEDEADQVARHGTSLLGARVLDTAGFEHGTVADVSVDPATGRLLLVTGDGGSWAAAQLRALGSYALVVDAGPRA